MEYPAEIISKIVGCGTLGYPVKKIINVLDIQDAAAFEADFYNPESLVAQAYQKGIDKADYAIDMRLFDMAKNGDLDAMREYEKRKTTNIQHVNKQRDEFKFNQKSFTPQ